jgi:lambda family phage portal protein
MTDLTADHQTLRVNSLSSLGGGLEAAERNSRMTASWSPARGAPDDIIGRDAAEAGRRVRDQVLQDGHIRGALATERDTVVGSLFKLVALPDMDLLAVLDSRFNAAWEAKWIKAAEALFTAYAESPNAPAVDISREATLTELIRQGVSSTFIEGEVTAPVLWRKSTALTPFRTAIRNISPSRVSNPRGVVNDQLLTNGILRNADGEAIKYYVRKAHPETRIPSLSGYEWSEIPARKPWGRAQFLHIYQADMAEQTRAVSDLTAAIVASRANKQLRELQLQNAIVSASYVAAVVSELPPDKVYELMGAVRKTDNAVGPHASALAEHLKVMQAYLGGENGLVMDGVKMPILPMGSKIISEPLGGDYKGHDELYKTIQRMVASSIGHVYEEFSSNWSNATYQSIKAAYGKSRRMVAAKKRFVADRYASAVYALFVEEMVATGALPLPEGVGREIFYEPLVKEALTACLWLGGAPGQIDELKETQAASLRMATGTSSLQEECARLGYDWRVISKNRAVVQSILEQYNLSQDLSSTKPGTMSDNRSPDNADPAAQDGGATA